MEHVSNLNSFSERAPGAPSILSYVKTQAALRRHALEFEYGMLDSQSARAVAKFSCVNCPTCRKATVWVSARTQLDGTWQVSHSVGSID